MSKVEAEHDPYVTKNEFLRITTDFEALHGMLQILPADLEAPMASGHTRQPTLMNVDESDVVSRAAKLSRLELPTFSGHYDD